MSVNKHLPHVLVLPEDDANRQIANGFFQNPSLHLRQIQVLPIARGWPAVRDSFAQHNKLLKQFPHRQMVLLVDFDNQAARRSEVTQLVDPDVLDRVFVLGAFTNPEQLRSALGESLEAIGKALAQECINSGSTVWGHALLRHNADERLRMQSSLRFLWS